MESPGSLGEGDFRIIFATTTPDEKKGSQNENKDLVMT